MKTRTRRRKMLATGGSMDGNPFPGWRSMGMNLNPASTDLPQTAPLANPTTLDITNGVNTAWMAPQGNNLQGIMQGVQSIAPYISNIVNTFKKAPPPPEPVYESTITPQRVSYAAQKAALTNRIRARDLGLTNNLDENTAAAVRASNLASENSGLSNIDNAEDNENAQLRSEADRVNAGIREHNNALTNAYNQQGVASQIANQRASSANLSNAADKFAMEEDQRRKEQLDLDKLKVYSQVWKNSGVYDRLIQELKQEGMANPTGIPTYATGGNLSRSADYGSSRKPYPMVSSSDFAGPNRSYPIPTRANAVDAARLARMHHDPEVLAKIHDKYPDVKASGGPLGPMVRSRVPNPAGNALRHQRISQGYVHETGQSPVYGNNRSYLPYSSAGNKLNDVGDRMFSTKMGGAHTLPQMYRGIHRRMGHVPDQMPGSNVPGVMASGGMLGQPTGQPGQPEPPTAATTPAQNQLSDQDIYQNYVHQLDAQGNHDSGRVAAVLTLSHKYGVPPSQIYTSTDHADGGTVPIRRRFDIVKDGKLYKQLYQDLAGDGAGPNNQSPAQGGLPVPVDSLAGTQGIAGSFAAGGGIHINPENKGKFTATMRSTGKTASQLAHSPNPLTRRRAIFALNERKWHH